MAFELVIGVGALALTIIIPKANPVIASLIGLEPSFMHHWAMASYQFFSDLIRANPMRPEAGMLRRKIFEN